MQNVMQGGDCSNSQPTSLNSLRRDILAVIIGNPLFTSEEQLLTNHEAHECEDPQRLALWLRNAYREAERRERSGYRNASIPFLATPSDATQAAALKALEKFYDLNDDLDAVQAINRRVFFEFLRIKPSLTTDELEIFWSVADLLAELSAAHRIAAN